MEICVRRVEGDAQTSKPRNLNWPISQTIGSQIWRTLISPS